MNEGTENGVKERGALQSKRFTRKEFPNLTRTRFFLSNVHLMCWFLRRARCARRQCERRARRTYGTPYTSVIAIITGNSAFFFFFFLTGLARGKNQLKPVQAGSTVMALYRLL